MPCIVETPEDRIDELATENKRLKGALCAALRTLYAQHTDPTWPSMPVTTPRNAHALVELVDSGVSAEWLRNWWHSHYDQDLARREQETVAAQRQQLRDQALKKLSPAERAALGHPVPKPDGQAAAPSGRRNQGMPGGDV